MNAIESQQICARCEQALRQGTGRLANVPALIKRIIEEELWKERKVETGAIVRLKSFRELIILDPYDGWGEDPNKIEAIIRDDPEVYTLWRETMFPHGGDRRSSDFNHYNIMVEPRQGTSRAYTLSRLKREYPELFEEVVAGRLSAHAAAIKAGFHK